MAGKKVLLDKKLPKLIQHLHKQKIKVIALTSSPIQSFGKIEEGESWRLNHLRELNIHFEKSFSPLTRFQINLKDTKTFTKPVFNRGVLFSGGISKAEVLLAFLEQVGYKPSRVIFVDDNRVHLEDMERKLLQLQIPYHGYHFKSKHLNKDVDEAVARFQFEYLFKHHKWLSDEEAQLHLKQQQL